MKLQGVVDETILHYNDDDYDDDSEIVVEMNEKDIK